MTKKSDILKQVDMLLNATDMKSYYQLGTIYEMGLDHHRLGIIIEKDELKAVAYYRKAADEGHSGAQYNLGYLYKNGIGVATDEKEAAQFYALAADQGDAEAQCILGVYYEEGKILDKDIKKAVTLYQQAADQGHPKALFRLAECYFYNRGIDEKDENGGIALKLYREAAHKNNADAQLKVGNFFQTGELGVKNREGALQFLELAAKQGNVQVRAQAMRNLGQCYQFGVSEPARQEEIDQKQAIQYYRLAANLGDAKAQYNLAIYYVEGRVVPRNPNKGVKLFQLAANQGYAWAQSQMGYLYQKGVGGVNKDEEKAVRLYHLAAAQDNWQAQQRLGICYANAIGVEKDLHKALQLLSSAFNQARNPETAYFLSLHFLPGQPTCLTPDAKHAVSLLEYSARGGVALAKTALSHLYAQGLGIEKDEKKAIEFCRSAVEQREAGAQFLMATFYEQGTGVEKDEKKALEFYRLAANQRNVQAQNVLADLYEQGKWVEKNPTEGLRFRVLAAEQGNLVARSRLGDNYMRRIGVEATSVVGRLLKLFFYQLSKQPSVITMAQYHYWVGYQFEKGTYSAPDQKIALRLYQLAADWGGSPSSEKKLNIVYQKTLGLNLNSSEITVIWNLFRNLANSKIGWSVRSIDSTLLKSMLSKPALRQCLLQLNESLNQFNLLSERRPHGGQHIVTTASLRSAL